MYKLVTLPIISMLAMSGSTAVPEENLEVVPATAIVQTLAVPEESHTITVSNGTWAKEISTIKVTPAPEPPTKEKVTEAPVSRNLQRTAPEVESTSTPQPRNSEAEPKVEQEPKNEPTKKAPKDKRDNKPKEKAAESPSKDNNDAAPSASGQSVVNIAKRYIGTPYIHGGSTPKGFDCSGFTSYVYAQVGVNLPRSSSAQGNVGKRVSKPQPGDLIWSPGHVAIYVGGGKQIDAPRPGKSIQVRSIWQKNPVYIRVL